MLNLGKKIWLIIVVLTLIIIIIGLLIFTKPKKREDTSKDIVNSIYWVNQNNDRINSSKGIQETQIIGDLSIEKSEIKRDDIYSTLTAKVTNNGNLDKKNIRLQVRFYDLDDTEITSTIVLVKDLNPGEVTYINASISVDVSSASKIEYEFVE